MKLEKLDPPIDLDHDHILGPLDANELTGKGLSDMLQLVGHRVGCAI